MEELGINPVLLLAQIVSFGLLFLVFKMFLFSKIQEALEERRQAVNRALEGKVEMEKKLKEFEVEREKTRRDDEAEHKQLLAVSKNEALTKRKEIIEQAAEEAAQERRKGEERLLQETEEVKVKLKKEMSNVAVEMAKDIVQSVGSDEKWQREKIKSSLEIWKKQK